MLTQERLKQLLRYDPQTGDFFWLADRGGRRAGDIAGCKKRTYIAISVDDKIYRAHHLAWLWMTGAFPTLFIDHRDLNKHNNAWENLREATKSQNQANTTALVTNKSGLKGAWFYKAYGKWTSQIWKDKRAYFLGYFDTAEEAHAAYAKKAKELYGEFARAA